MSFSYLHMVLCEVSSRKWCLEYYFAAFFLKKRSETFAVFHQHF